MTTPTPAICDNLDGTRTEFFDVDVGEAPLRALLTEVFEEHWDRVIFGPCIEGAVFEGRFPARPRVSLLDGYVTVEVGGSESWHFHLCIVPHRGTPALPTPPELARWRRCARAAFFCNRDRAGRASATPAFPPTRRQRMPSPPAPTSLVSCADKRRAAEVVK